MFGPDDQSRRHLSVLEESADEMMIGCKCGKVHRVGLERLAEVGESKWSTNKDREHAGRRVDWPADILTSDL